MEAVGYYQYGDKVIDSVTGYIGKVTARCDYYNTKPAQYAVESIDSTGRPCEYWVESTRLRLFEED